MGLSFSQPNDILMKQITAYVKEYALDDEDMQPEQFVAALVENKLVGFGRLRKHTECDEIGSLGVVTEYRGKGIGKAIVNELIKQTNNPLYVVCIIPGFFEKIGFEIINERIPASIEKKHERCTREYVVEEEYCVMKFNYN